MRIGELSEATGTSVRLLRYYEEQGLLESERLASGHRRYGEGALVAVRRIRSFLDAGLPTRVIRELLPCVVGDGTVDGCKLDALQDHLRGLDDRISALSQARTSLTGLITATRAREGSPAN
ncbi:MerR family transcriptional regulator [Streptomyces sp. NPDC002690]